MSVTTEPDVESISYKPNMYSDIYLWHETRTFENLKLFCKFVSNKKMETRCGFIELKTSSQKTSIGFQSLVLRQQHVRNACHIAH